MLRLSMTTPLRGSLLGDILRMIGVIEFVVSRFLHKNIPVTCAVGHRLVSRNKAAFTNNARALNGTGGEMSASERFIVHQENDQSSAMRLDVLTLSSAVAISCTWRISDTSLPIWWSYLAPLGPDLTSPSTGNRWFCLLQLL